MARKVTLNGETIIDLSNTTAVPMDVAEGKVFFTSEGVPAAGTDEIQESDLLDLPVTENGNYSAPDGQAWNFVSVSVTPNLQSKNCAPTTEEVFVGPDSGYDGLSFVSVAAIRTQSKDASENGLVKPDEGYYLAEVNVNVQPPLQTKSTKSSGIVRPDEGYYGLSAVTVEIPQQEASLQTKEAVPNGSRQIIEADAGYNGLYNVIVESIPSEYIIPTGYRVITSNGLVNVANLKEVIVNTDGGSGGAASVTSIPWNGGQRLIIYDATASEKENNTIIIGV